MLEKDLAAPAPLGWDDGRTAEPAALQDAAGAVPARHTRGRD